jgi:hypothetical protein
MQPQIVGHSNSDNLPDQQNSAPAQNDPQATQGSYPGYPTESHATAAPAAQQRSTFACMQAAKRWLVWSSKVGECKQPFYVNGVPRQGELDSPADWDQLGTYEQAVAAYLCSNDRFEGIGFALGPDGTGNHWQGIDLDDIPKNLLSDIANTAPGYVEVSPSETGIHAIGYGKNFPSLGPNKTGVEAYAAKRYFTVTENTVRDSHLVCLADYVTKRVVAAHGRTQPVSEHAAVTNNSTAVIPSKVLDLRSALFFMRADEYHLWISMGQALCELGETGRGLWLEWSAMSEKFNPQQASKKWSTFSGERSSHEAVFAEAQRRGWSNPNSNAARGIDKATRSDEGTALGGPRELQMRDLNTVQMRAINWLWPGWIPQGYVTIWAGETGAGKSTVLADVTARITTGTPWPEEPLETRRQPGRVLWLGSEDGIEELTVPRLVACSANLANVTEIQGVTQRGQRNTFSMQDDIEAVRAELKKAREHSASFAMLVIDPITSYLPGQKLRKVDLNDAGQLRSVLEPWLAVAQEYSLAIVCVTHFMKDTTRSMLHRVLGSAAFTQTCRSLCAVVARTEDGMYAKTLLQVKVNLPEHPGGAWKFITAKVQVGVDPSNGKPIHATHPVWEELDCDITPESLVGGTRGPVGKQADKLGPWLKQYFASIPAGQGVPVTSVIEAALAAGAVTKRGWDEKSKFYLDKKNVNGTWLCRPFPSL